MQATCAFRQRGDLFERGEGHPTSIDEVHAQPAHTAKMQSFDLRVGDVFAYACDRPQPIRRSRDDVQHGVGSMDVGPDDHCARYPKRLMQGKGHARYRPRLNPMTTFRLRAAAMSGSPARAEPD